MTSEVVWSDRANRDLETLHDYIAKDSPRSAASYVEGLRHACRRLADYPQSGKVFNETYRVVVYRNHLVFHRYNATTRVVVVVRVIDARRDLNTGLEQLGF